jgi:hypothetical protein
MVCSDFEKEVRRSWREAERAERRLRAAASVSCEVGRDVN